MKRKGLSPTVGIAIVAVLMVAIIAFFIIQTALNGWVIDKSDAVKAGVILAGMGVTLVKIASKVGRKRPLADYDSLYRKEIGNAFSRRGQEKLKKKLLKSIALYNENQYTNAISSLRELESSCNSAEDLRAVLLFLAISLSESGLTDDAIKEYEKLLKYDSKNSTAHSNLGLLYKKQGNDKKAIECYKNAIEADENNAYAHNNLAQAYLAAGDWKNVIEPAQRSVALKSDMYQAETALSIAFFAMGESEQSKLHFDRAIMHGADADKITNILSSISKGYNPFGSGDIREEIERAIGFLQRDTALPMVQIRLPAPDDGNFSRIGGAPVDIDVPLDSKGAPMRLLAAIRCSEVRGVPDFPERGVLRFYISDNEFYGADFDRPTAQSDFRVLYDSDEDKFDAVQTDDPDISPSFPVRRCLPVRFTPAIGSVLASDYRFEACLDSALKKAGIENGVDELDDSEYDRIYDTNSYGGHRIGGYPCFEQFDPRESDPELQKYDTLLLQIVSHSRQNESGEDECLIMFGDEGGCQFFIPRNKLRARDFSDVLYWWDCG